MRKALYNKTLLSQISEFRRLSNYSSLKSPLFADGTGPRVIFIRPHGFCYSLETIAPPSHGEELILSINLERSMNISVDVFVSDPGKQVFYAISGETLTGDSIHYAEEHKAKRDPVLVQNYDLEVHFLYNPMVMTSLLLSIQFFATETDGRTENQRNL